MKLRGVELSRQADRLSAITADLLTFEQFEVIRGTPSGPKSNGIQFIKTS